MILAWEAWKIVGFITELATSWMEVAQDQGISVLAPLSTVPGPENMVFANICDIMLRILEEDSSMHTPGSALKRTVYLESAHCWVMASCPAGQFLFSRTLGRPFLVPLWCLSCCLPLPKFHTPASSSCYSQCLPWYPFQSS